MIEIQPSRFTAASEPGRVGVCWCPPLIHRNFLPEGDWCGSTLKAVEKLRAAGYQVSGVVALVDRLEGGREAIEAAGLAFIALYTRRDFMPD